MVLDISCFRKSDDPAAIGPDQVGGCAGLPTEAPSFAAACPRLGRAASPRSGGLARRARAHPHPHCRVLGRLPPRRSLRGRFCARPARRAGAPLPQPIPHPRGRPAVALAGLTQTFVAARCCRACCGRSASAKKIATRMSSSSTPSLNTTRNGGRVRLRPSPPIPWALVLTRDRRAPRPWLDADADASTRFLTPPLLPPAGGRRRHVQEGHTQPTEQRLFQCRQGQDEGTVAPFDPALSLPETTSRRIEPCNKEAAWMQQRQSSGVDPCPR